MAVSGNGTDWNGWKESTFDGESILAVAYGNGKFAAAGDKGKIRYSGSGDSGTWSNAQTTPFGETTVLGLAYGESLRRFVAVGDGGKIAWSDDGITWNPPATAAGFGTDTVNAVAYGNGKFVAVGNAGKIAHSSDGKTWTFVTDNVFDSKGILSVCYGSGKFTAAGHNGKMAESGNGVSWTKIDPGTKSNQNQFSNDEQIGAIAYGGGMFIAGGNAYTGDTAKITYGY
jgi:hypothetical protein